MKASITVFVVCLFSVQILANDIIYPYQFSSKARSGDGIISLLRRYHLDEYDCNFKLFCELNGLEENAHLVQNVQYKLPVKIYKYNYQSIRSTIGIDDWDLARAIAAYNRQLKESGMRRSTYTESGILWVPHHLISCDETNEAPLAVSIPEKAKTENETENIHKPEVVKEAEVVKVARKTINVPTFGEEAEVEIKSEKLKDKVYYLISGHGGPDPGAIGTCCSSSSLCEDEYAYDVTLRLAKLLLEQGAIVHIIIQDPDDGIRNEEILLPDKDEVCLDGSAIPLNQLSRLKQRVDAVNKLYDKHRKEGIKEQKAIAIHIDSRASSKRQDVFFYYYEKSKSGRQLALDVYGTFKDKYKIHRKSGEYHGFVTSRNLYVLRNTKPTALYVELANIRNSTDQKRVTKVSNRQALANWLYEGLTGL
jgi:N-acetylmuramoyl-L-alanine amidase